MKWLYRLEMVKRYADLWGFFAFSHGWTWCFWAPAIVWGENVWTSSALIFLGLGGLGPPLGGIVMTGLTRGRPGLQELWRRAMDARRIRAGWWAVILLLFPGVMLLAAAVALLLGASVQPLDLHAALGRLLQPGDLLLFAGFILLLGPVPEEIGWRGYLLDRLQERWSALTASLMLGAAWGAWHIPLFFLVGYFGEFSPEPARFMFSIMMIAVLYTWIHNNTRQSLLAAILFHFMGNLTGEWLEPSDQVRLYSTFLIALVVMLVVLGWGASKLRRSSAGR